MHEIVSLIDAELVAIGDPEKVYQMEAYMKHKFLYYGVTSPERKSLVGQLWKEYKSQIKEDWRPICAELWMLEKRECQYVAMDLLGKVKSAYMEEDVLLAEKFILHKSWWDTVDFVASTFVGALFSKYPALIPAYNPVWIDSENIWLNRTAILFQLKYKDKVDFDLLKSNINRHIGSKEFFINKASGWALRQYSKFDSFAVQSYVEMHPELSNLTKREASKYLP